MPLTHMIAEVAICILMAFIAIKLGLRMFLFTLISLAGFYMMLTLCINFTEPMARILAPWIHITILRPIVVVLICGTVLYVALRLTRFVEVILRNLSGAGNIALGGALAVTLTIIVFELFLKG